MIGPARDPKDPSRGTVRVIGVVVALVGIALLYTAYVGNAREIGVRRHGVEATATVDTLPTKSAPAELSYTADGQTLRCNLVAGNTRAGKGAQLRVVADRTDPGACVPAGYDLGGLLRTAIVLLFGLAALVGAAWLLINA